MPAANKLRSLRADIKSRIGDLAEGGYLTSPQRDEVKASWDKFEEDYIKAMEDFVSIGLHGEAVMRQAESRRVDVDHVAGSRRRLSLAPGLGDPVGRHGSRGRRQPRANHPAVAPRAHEGAGGEVPPRGGLRHPSLLPSGSIHGDREIFMRELSDEIAHPFYPEIAVLNRAGAPTLVSESSTVNGYSLLESPTRGRGGRHDRRGDPPLPLSRRASSGALCRFAAP